MDARAFFDIGYLMSTLQWAEQASADQAKLANTITEERRTQSFPVGPYTGYFTLTGDICAKPKSQHDAEFYIELGESRICASRVLVDGTPQYQWEDKPSDTDLITLKFILS